MILEKGNMWDVFGKTDLFLVTTNPIIRKDGAAVMGRGIAKEAATRFPSLPYDFGELLKGRHVFDPSFYIGTYDGQPVGCFMVKHHWADTADVGLIAEAVARVKERCLATSEIVSSHRVDLNFPGIGNGKLKREDVLPIIEQLPDNVHVWEYK